MTYLPLMNRSYAVEKFEREPFLRSTFNRENLQLRNS